MCGIAGIYKSNGEIPSAELLKKMSDVLFHRGPDGEGQWLREQGKNVGFSHRRLSILDLSDAGRQPMSYHDGNYTITYNGEIYNYLEIKETLKGKGYTFKSNSDTEVLLALYDYKKEKCLDDLDGMFAFAIWDEPRQQLFCARDRFGEKPFHYYWDGASFYFGSEIKALFAGGIEKHIDQDIMKDYLKNGLIERGSKTFFTGINKLEPSHYLIIKGSKLEIKRYWDIQITDTTFHKTDQEYASHFREIFRTSIKRRLRSDVPVGSSLSGGLDSSSVVCFINEMLPAESVQKTFSARFHDPTKDEGKWINYVTDKTRTEQHEVFPDPADIVEEIEKMLYHHEYPFGSASICAQWNVMRLAKQNGVTVMLDGQGADEFLAGYYTYRNYPVWEHYFKFNFKAYLSELKDYRNKYHEKQNLGLKYLVVPYLRWLGILSGITSYYTPLKEKLKHDLTHSLQELLAYADRNAMAFSIETRLPFLYHELVSFTLSCPAEQLYSHAISKRILRNAIRGIVPDEIVDRKDKLGYEPPQSEWMKKIYNEAEVKGILESQGLEMCGIVWRDYIVSKFIATFR